MKKNSQICIEMSGLSTSKRWTPEDR